MKKLLSSKFLFSIVGSVILFFPLLTFAQATGEAQKTLESVAAILSVGVRLLAFFTMLFLNYGGDLMGTEFLLGENILPAIESMWIVVRNFVNISFVVFLLVVVFANILGLGLKGWTIKEKLPKILISILAVNFSLMAFKVMIDMVHVVTMTVLAIPQSVLEDRGRGSIKDILMQGVSNAKDGNKDAQFCDKLSEPATLDNKPPSPFEDGKKVELKKAKPNQYGTSIEDREFTSYHTGHEECAPFYAKLNSVMCGNARNEAEAKAKDDCLMFINPSRVNNQVAKSNAAHNLLLSFGVYFYRIEQLPSLAANLNSLEGVVTNILFSSIMTLAIFIALAALFIVLLVRVVALWIYMVFSPVIITSSIMGLNFSESLSFKKVLTVMFVPVKVAAAFAIAFVLSAFMIGVDESQTAEFIIMGPSLSSFGYGMMGLMWQIATIGIFWTTSFSAMKGVPFADKWIGKIQSTAAGLGTSALKAATIDRPIFQLPANEQGGAPKVSLGALLQTPELVNQNLNNQALQNLNQMRSYLSMENSDTMPTSPNEIQSTKDKILQAGSDRQQLSTVLDEFGKKTKIDEMNMNSNLRKEMTLTLQSQLEKITTLSQDQKQQANKILESWAVGTITAAQFAALVNIFAQNQKAKESDYQTNPVASQNTRTKFTYQAPGTTVSKEYENFDAFAKEQTGQTIQRSELTRLADLSGKSVNEVKATLTNNGAKFSATVQTIDKQGNDIYLDKKKKEGGTIVTEETLVKSILANIDKVGEYNSDQWKSIYEAFKGKTVRFGNQSLKVGDDSAINSVEKFQEQLVNLGLQK